MGFFELDPHIDTSGGLSAAYFEKPKLEVFEELFQIDFRFVEVEQARYYSVCYAEARMIEILAKQETTTTRRTFQTLIDNHDDWHKASQQTRHGDYEALGEEIEKDANLLIRKGDTSHFANVLYELAEKLRE